MPRSKSWASQGGIAPTGLNINLETDKYLSNEVKTGEGVQERDRDGQADKQEGEQDQHHHQLGEDKDEVGEPGDRQQHHREGQEPDHQPHHHLEGGGDKSCNYSMHIRMPRSKSWAPPGGIAPTEHDLIVETNFDNSEVKGKEGTVAKDTKLQCLEEEEGKETPPEPHPVNGEQTGHYIDSGGGGRRARGK